MRILKKQIFSEKVFAHSTAYTCVVLWGKILADPFQCVKTAKIIHTENYLLNGVYIVELILFISGYNLKIVTL